MNVTWNEGQKADLSSEGLRTAALDGLPKPGSLGKNEIDAVYEIPYEAHATMEPMNCTAYMHDDVCEVWAPTQNPQEVQHDVSAALGISQKNVTVHIPLMGGGFGRRLQSDYGVEAARVSQAINAPVQVFWTRDDDLQHDYYCLPPSFRASIQRVVRAFLLAPGARSENSTQLTLPNVSSTKWRWL